MIRVFIEGKRRIYILLSLLLFVQANGVFAQDLVTGDFHGASLEEFAAKVESQTHFHFYYDSTASDSLTITISVHQAHLPAILDTIFRNTNLYYSIDRDGHVFITKGFAIATALPEGFFSGKKDTGQTVANNRPVNSSPSAAIKKLNPEISVENKLFDIGVKRNEIPKGNVNVAGYVRDAQTGETISGALIYLDGSRVQVNTDQFGYYSLVLPAGRHTLNVMTPGMFDTKRQVMLYSDGTLSINMNEKVIQLKEVVIEAGKEKNVRGTTMGVDKISILAMKQMPAIMGEVDVLRTVLTLPGVKSVGEASTGLNVRGGATDQNLILFNGMNIYNPSHLFGFFSAFDPDLVKEVNLYKGSIPAKYGGRISSVLDITSLDGNDKKLSGSAGIGPLTSKATIGGPIDKKTTFVAGVRSTYSSWLFKTLPQDYKKSRASFGDASLHVNRQINTKNNVYLNVYISNDKFNLNSDTSYQYHNANANINWKHNFNNRFYVLFSGGMDYYDYKVVGFNNPVNAYQLSYSIRQYKFTSDFNYFLNNNHKLNFGLSSLDYGIHPGSFRPSGKASLVTPDALEAEHALESAAYFSDQITVTSKFSAELGLRYSLFNFLGPKHVLDYAPGLPRQESNIVDTSFYPAGKIIKTYKGPEYRASARYIVSDNSSVKASYNTTRQYIHMISNTTTISPTDVWTLSDPNIKPQMGSQVSLGFYKNFKSNVIEASVEVYYKWIENYLDYKSGAVLIMNHHLETDVFTTRGKSYGIELLVKKETGRLNGWASYTFSRSLIRQDDPIAGEVINGGNYYPSNFDQPHNTSIIGNYRLTHRFSLSMNLIYSTGRPVTVPVGVFDYGGSARLLYSDRNKYRIPDYFRTDFSVNVDGNHKLKQKSHNSWTIGFYNLTARKNPYSVYFSAQNGHVQGYILSIFGTVIPFVTFNIRF